MFNVIYAHTHDSGRYMSPYGYALNTPNIQKFAEESILFRQAFCSSPTCSPSRAALTTGMTAHTSGMLGLTHRGFALLDSRRHLSWFFHDRQFETALAGVQHETTQVSELGYDRVLSYARTQNLSRRDTDIHNALSAAAFIREEHKSPFFLSFGMSNTHRPYPDHREAGLRPDYMLPPWFMEDTPENRSDIADYACAIQTVDECMGIIMKALRESGRNQDTIVLFTTDHGLPMPMMKCNLLDAGIGVAMILSYPGNPATGSICDQLVSHVDVFPTLCEILGLRKPDWLQGVSLLPLIEKGVPTREAIFAEVNYHASYEPMRCVRTARHKLIIRYDDRLYPALANIDSSPAKERLISAGFAEYEHPREALYDLRIDPAEKVNLACNPSYAQALDDLRARLMDWMRLTDDPLLRYKHRIPKPRGAKVNPRECREPDCGIYESPDNVS